MNTFSETSVSKTLGQSLNPGVSQLTITVDEKTEFTPLIGLSAAHEDGISGVGDNYVKSILKAGGAPVIIPVTHDAAALRTVLALLDGLVLTGGADINPLIYGEQPAEQLLKVDPVRDTYELTLLKIAVDLGIPILGICRGHQLVNVAFGGTLYQDLSFRDDVQPLKHRQTLPGGGYGLHNITVMPGSVLASIFGDQTLSVSSFHHQSVKDVADGFRVTALSEDGVVEVVEAYPGRKILCVQFHPEVQTAAGDPSMLKIFRFLVDEAGDFHKNKMAEK